MVYYLTIYLFVFTIVTGYSMAWYLGKTGGDFDGVLPADMYSSHSTTKSGYLSMSMSNKWNPTDSLKIGQNPKCNIKTRDRSINLTYGIPDKVDVDFLI
jgi:hypothetical protein